MDMKRLASGRLRAAGYDRKTQKLRVELDDGTLLDYAGVGEDVWRRLSSSAAAWSFYRDSIEEEYTATRSRKPPGEQPKANPLDDLFGPK